MSILTFYYHIKNAFFACENESVRTPLQGSDIPHTPTRFYTHPVFHVYALSKKRTLCTSDSLCEIYTERSFVFDDLE
jgi:hypothetical protein